MESSAGIAERGAPVGGVDRPVGRGERRSPRSATPSTRRLDGTGLIAHALDYLALTKPRIISLLLWTTVATMFVARPSGLALSTVLWTCLGGYLAAGGAGAINHYIDRDIDARMGRTRGRPIVSGRIEPIQRPGLRNRPRRAGHRAALGHRQCPRRRPRDGRAARLRPALHGVAEAQNAAEHRHRRRRRSDAAHWSAGPPPPAVSPSTRSSPS